MKILGTNVVIRFVLAGLVLMPSIAVGEPDYAVALRRAQYMLNGTMPTDSDFSNYSRSKDAYDAAVRAYIENPSFYNVMMRYHQRIFGVGLRTDYLDELLDENIDGKTNKFARITCTHTTGTQGRYRCFWTSTAATTRSGGCPEAWEVPSSVFWYPGIVAWVCPTIQQTCGSDLSRCFIEYDNEDEAKNSELGTTEVFDSRYAVVNSLSRQAAGLATVIVTENYPYTKILEPGLSAVDGAIVHFYRQSHHFRIEQMNIPADVLSAVETVPLTDTRFRLVKSSGDNYDSGGVISTFGWLRRYDKNRTRANQLYERLLCRSFVSELPRVFPQDPGNLRTAPGCSGCHATLDPLADFFLTWGEAGNLYQGAGSATETTFNNQSGRYVSDLAEIVRNDQAFATCSVQNAWEWLMGRKFYTGEDRLRAALTDYFVTTNYSFKELVYAIATHPAFTEQTRGNGVVTDPLEAPPLGQAPGTVERECETTYDYTADIAPKITNCTNCHSASSTTRQPLTTEAQWRAWGSQSVDMMSSGQMPPGQAGPEILEFKEIVRCWLEQ